MKRCYGLDTIPGVTTDSRRPEAVLNKYPVVEPSHRSLLPNGWEAHLLPRDTLSVTPHWKDGPPPRPAVLSIRQRDFLSIDSS